LTRLELQTSDAGSNRSANCATTALQCIKILIGFVNGISTGIREENEAVKGMRVKS